MTNYSETELLEMAQALGFSSVVEMEDHQVWLNEQAGHRAEVKVLIEKSKDSNVIDLRNLR